MYLSTKIQQWMRQSTRVLKMVVLGGMISPAFAASKQGVAVTNLPPAANVTVDFVKDIQPILAQNCYACHGPKEQKSDLRWDVKEIAMRGSDHGPVIVPGKSAESLMIQLVSGMKPDEIMPQKADPLTPQQIGLLRAWIDQGAKWPEGLEPVNYLERKNNWSFQPLHQPKVPVVKNKKWVRNPIDNFVDAKLESLHLHPSPEADRITLIRRLSLDLTGLPPTISEVDKFVADRSPDAYEKVVERLLASPHYGEQWGRHWLDVARYADSNGYEKDLYRSIWPYRDWVIKAFNDNLPFNEFTIEQLAGDLLPNATLDQKVATGFNRNTMLNEEGGIDPEEFRVAAIINRVETTGKAWLGLTINCAQCHSHKYDPISQKEYYQFFAFLNNDDEPTVDLPSQAQQAKRAEIKTKVAKIEDDLLKKDPELKTRQIAWEKKMRGESVTWEVLKPDAYYGAVGTKFDKMADESLLATGSNPPFSTYNITVKTKLTNISAFRLEVLTEPNLPHNGPGRSPNGNFVLTDFSVDAVSPDGKTNHVVLQNPTADFSQPEFSITNAIMGKGERKTQTGWAVDGGPGHLNQDRNAVFETAEKIGFPEGTTLLFTMKQLFGSQHTIGRFRLSATTQPEHPIKADILTRDMRQIINLPAEQRTAAQQHEVFSFYRKLEPNAAEADKKIADLLATWPTADTTLVLEARPKGRDSHIFRRGDFRNPMQEVQPGVPAFLPPLPAGAPLNRLTFANWLVDAKNPLTSRVIMNRFWMAYFGRGIVVTAEDFGTQGDKPSNQPLLDWLASEFIRRNWDVKAMQRLIVESATYRQSSKATPQEYAEDPYNRLLARGPRFRVEAEEIRDIALQAGGLLSPKIGGPSVFPPIPDGVMSLAYGASKWETSTGEDRYRRGLYTYWKRTVPYPGLSIFDAPNADVTCVRRVMSDTPLQALTTLNDTVFHEAARAMAMRVYKEGGKTDRDRAIYAFKLCTGRAPDEMELTDLLKLVQQQENYFDERTTDAIEVAAPDQKNPPAQVNLHKVAAWTVASRVLLNLDETITKE